MATKVYMEALSPTMEEGRLLSWLKNEGEPVKEGDVVAEVETDKATMELVARGSGVLRKRILDEGATASVGSLIAVIASADEDIAGIVGGDAVVQQGPTSGADPGNVPDPQAAGSRPEADLAAAAAVLAGSEHTEPDQAERGTAIDRTLASEAPTPTPDQGTLATTQEGHPSIVQTGQQQPPAEPQPQGGAQGGQQPSAPAGVDGNGRVKASPLARRLAADAGVQLGAVQGSGPGGRVIKRDIEAAMQQAQQAPPAAPAAPAAQLSAPVPTAPPAAPGVPAAPAAPVPQPGAGTGTGFRDLPLTQMRKTIAKRLSQSIGPIPTFYLTVEIDMAEAMVLRKRINERFAGEGIRVSPNDLVIKACAAALRRHPMVNASWTGEAIRQFDAAHIGIAVAVEEGLITPVVRDADRKGIAEIAQEVKELAGRARDRKLQPNEYTGATFSISNLGMFGIEEFTAVINPPEAAILAVGQAADKAVVVDGQVQIRSRMRVTLSCDHRVIDGATGADFLRTLKQYLEEPMLMIA